MKGVAITAAGVCIGIALFFSLLLGSCVAMGAVIGANQTTTTVVETEFEKGFKEGLAGD